MEMEIKVGRPKKRIDWEKFWILVGKGMNQKQVARELGVSLATLQKKKQEEREKRQIEPQPVTAKE